MMKFKLGQKVEYKKVVRKIPLVIQDSEFRVAGNSLQLGA